MAQVTLKIKIDLPGIRSELEQVVREIKEKLEPLGVIEFEADLDDFKDDLEDVEDKVNKTGKAADSTREKFAQWGMILSGFQSAKTIISDIYSILSMPLDVAGQFEDYNTQFEVLLGSTDKAKKMIADLTDFASRTPLELPGILENTKMLLNFGVEADSVMDIIQMIGDVSGGNAQRMSSLTLAFAQMSSTGRLTGQDLLQMINAGFNPLQAISEKIGKSIGELKKDMEAGAISADMVTEAFRSVTSEGGQFYNMLQKQSTGWNGLKSTFTDTMNEMAMELGDKLLPAAKVTLGFLIEATQFLTENMSVLLATVKVLGVGVAAYTIAVHGAALAKRAYAIAVNIATIATHGFNTALKANPIGLVASLVAMLVVALGELTDWFGLAADSSEDADAKLKQIAESALDSGIEISKLKKEFEKLTDADLLKGLEEINEALKGTGISAQQRKEFEAYKQAITEVLNDRKQKEQQISSEIARLKIEAMEDGIAKERATLDLWLKEMKEKYVGNAKAIAAVMTLYYKQLNDLESDYFNRSKEKAEKQREERESLLKEQEENERDFANEQTQIHLRKNEYIAKSDKEYFDDKYSLMVSKMQEEIKTLKLQGADEVAIARRKFQLEKELYDDMLQNKQMSQEEYNRTMLDLTQDSLMAMKNYYSEFSSFIIDNTFRLLNYQRQYTQNDINLKQFQYEEERKALQESLANQEISRREYDLRMRALEEDRSRFMKDVEEDRKSFSARMADELYSYILKKAVEWLADQTALLLAELTLHQTTEAAKTASTEQGVLARIALYSLEILKQLASAAAAIARAIAEGIAYLFASLGPFAIPAIAGLTGATIAAWNGIKESLGFKKGGFTGYGDPEEEAGIVHKNEYVFESNLVSKEPDKFALLHRLLRGGMSLTDILHNLSAAMGDPSAPARVALAGINLTSPAVQQQLSNNSRIESLLASIDDRLKSQNDTGIKVKLESAVVSIRYSVKELFAVLKLRQKLENKRTVENG